MSQQNKAQNVLKRLEKRLSLENLESRQLLSASPVSVDADMIETSTFATSNTDLQVDLALQAEGEGEGEGEGGDQGDQQQQVDKTIPVSAEGKKLTATFKAEEKVPFTVVIKATDSAGKVTTTFKTITPTAKKIAEDGTYTFTYTGKENCQYDLTVVNGKYTKKDYAADNEQIKEDDIRAIGSVSTLSTLKLAATPNAATSNSITFQQKSGEPLVIDNLVFSAKFDGAKTATEYTVSNGKLVDPEGQEAFTIAANDDATTVTISGLKLNTKQTFQVAQKNDDGSAVSAYSSKLTISTTKEQQNAPTDVTADFVENTNDVNVKFTVDEANKDDTFTVSCTYTDANGKVKTKVLSSKVKVAAEGEGENAAYKGSYTATKLSAGTKYTFSVTTNKTKDYDASVATESNAVITKTETPAAKLKKTFVNDTTAVLQVSNWSKMEAALQEVQEGEGGKSAGGVLTVNNGEDVIAEFQYRKTGEAEGNDVYEWVNTLEGNTATMQVVPNKKTNVANITIEGLEANTNYQFTVTTSSDVENENINGVAAATSKVLKVKTLVAAYPKVTELTASSPDYKSINVKWTSEQTKFKVTVTPEAGGKSITKTVSGAEATITGLKANTKYKVEVVAKADKNGSESEAETCDVTTQEKLELVSATKNDDSNFALNFGVDMTQYSGRIDFTVSGSGKVYSPEYQRSGSDSVSATKCSLFFGDKAEELATAYSEANPGANVLVLKDATATANLPLTTKKYKVGLQMDWKFSAGATESTLELGLNDTHDHNVKATVKITGAEIQNNDDATKVMSAKLNKSLKATFKYEAGANQGDDNQGGDNQGE